MPVFLLIESSSLDCNARNSPWAVHKTAAPMPIAADDMYMKTGVGLRNMTTARGSRLSRWFTKEYLASGSDFDYEEEMKTKSSPDKVRIISQPEVVFHSLLLPCPICTLSTPTNWMKCGKTWRMKELPGTLRLKISFLLMELLRQTNIIITLHCQQIGLLYPLFKGLFWSDASHKMEQHWQVQLLQSCHVHRCLLNSLWREGGIGVTWELPK